MHSTPHIPAAWRSHIPAACSCPGFPGRFPLSCPECTVPARPRWNAGCPASTAHTVYGFPAFHGSAGKGYIGYPRTAGKKDPISAAGCSWMNSGRNPWASGSIVHHS